MEKKDILNIKCRDKSFIITKKELLSFCDESWFLSILVNTPFIEDDTNEYEVWEDYNTILSIIETLRYQKLIVLENVNLDYYLGLCDKWCLPTWIIDEIQNKKKNNNNNDLHTKIMNYIENNYIFKCDNCTIGFKISENTNTSCQKHRYSFDGIQRKFLCCNTSDVNNFCIKGYHISNISISIVYDEVKKIFINDC